jgi:hypothetical protein
MPIGVIPRSEAALKPYLPMRFRSGFLGQLAAYFVAAALFVALPIFTTTQLRAQTSPAPGQAPAPAAKPSHKKASSHAKLAAAPPAAQPAPPPAPPLPDWPANDRPSEATVTWDSRGLSIFAANSSLSQILKLVCSQTGATMEGLNRDQRIFGVYGPGTARDVISQLLDGSGYNVLMIGDVGQGTPRQIVLSSRTGGAPQPAVNNGQQNTDSESENDSEPDEQAQQPEPPPPPPQQQPPPTTTQGVPVRSQQEMIQELQQRQQQMQQQQNPQ